MAVIRPTAGAAQYVWWQGNAATEFPRRTMAPELLSLRSNVIGRTPVFVAGIGLGAWCVALKKQPALTDIDGGYLSHLWRLIPMVVVLRNPLSPTKRRRRGAAGTCFHA